MEAGNERGYSQLAAIAPRALVLDLTYLRSMKSFLLRKKTSTWSFSNQPFECQALIDYGVHHFHPNIPLQRYTFAVRILVFSYWSIVRVFRVIIAKRSLEVTLFILEYRQIMIRDNRQWNKQPTSPLPDVKPLEALISHYYPHLHCPVLQEWGWSSKKTFTVQFLGIPAKLWGWFQNCEYHDGTSLCRENKIGAGGKILFT